MMSVMIEAKMETKASELSCSVVFVPMHILRLLFHWREPKGLSGVLCLSSWRLFSYKIPICCISVPSC